MNEQSGNEKGGMDRRRFLRSTSLALGALGVAGTGWGGAWAAEPASPGGGLTVDGLPKGAAPAPVALPHFPDRLHAFVWRNWPLVPLDRMAEVVGARRGDLLRMGRAMGLAGPPRITADQRRRSALTVIRRNWHLLPYEQLLRLLDWTPERMAFTLREDDFFYIKLGSLKPRCEPLRYSEPNEAALARRREIAAVVRAEFPEGTGTTREPLFDFVRQLSRPTGGRTRSAPSAFSPRFCYSYFALYGDPLLEPDLDPYPDGLLERLAESGVNGVWLQGMLTRLAPFPWDPGQSARHEERLRNLRLLAQRARKRGIGLWLYLNEPRALPAGFFGTRAGLKGVREGEYAALCTSVPEVSEYLTEAIAQIGRAAPELAGFFSITGSENFTHCWSHHGGAGCPRCGGRAPAEVIAELNGAFQEGLRRAGHGQQLIVWDWGWADAWVPDTIARLPREALFMTVSEWGMPVRRGGVETTVGEYSISTVGPGERARRHWRLARERGLKTVAKVQCGNTWELSSVPYIPAVGNVARHAANLREAGVDGLMLGWTLGGYPSPNLEVVAALGAAEGKPDPEAAMRQVAERRFGAAMAPAVVAAWQAFSRAFSEFPYHGGVVYNAPMQMGPANLLWGEPSGYRATMVGLPYDDLDGWRSVYPAEVFAEQFEKVAHGFEIACAALETAARDAEAEATAEQARALSQELAVARAATIHFRSTANQVRFTMARRRLAEVETAEERRAGFAELESLLRAEIELARWLHDLQSKDSRLGFEASNQYFFVPVDLAEKVLNARDLLERWLPGERKRLGV